MKPRRSRERTSAWTGAGPPPKLASSMRLCFLALLLILSGCDVIEQPSGLIPRWTTAYRQVISENDRLRLRDWRKSFVDALAAAQKAGHTADISREGPLLDPD